MTIELVIAARRRSAIIPLAGLYSRKFGVVVSYDVSGRVR